MEYRLFENIYIIRLDRGDELLTSLKELCENENIMLGTVEAIGASDHAVVGLYDVEARQYHKHSFDGPMEITSLLGNISRKDGEVYLHLHINLCREDMSVVGGHLNECRISATSEMAVRRINGIVGRKLDMESTGLNLYQF